MMNLKTIQDLADEQARKAAKEKRRPYVPYDADEVRGYGTKTKVPFPNLGSYRPKGWTLEYQWFVDATGAGADWEPALTLAALRARVEANLERGYGYAIIEEGQFQVLVGVFAKKKG